MSKDHFENAKYLAGLLLVTLVVTIVLFASGAGAVIEGLAGLGVAAFVASLFLHSARAARRN
jgi:hypothetical protein